MHLDLLKYLEGPGDLGLGLREKEDGALLYDFHVWALNGDQGNLVSGLVSVVPGSRSSLCPKKPWEGLCT